LLQIWILPDKLRLTPGYEQKTFGREEKQGKLRLVASRGGGDGSVHINQDVQVYSSILKKGDEVSHLLGPDRFGWVQLISGSLDLNGTILTAGDGAAISDDLAIKIRSRQDETEFLLFDLN